MKVVNLLVPTKKGLVSQSTKPKLAKKGDDSSETCSDIIPYKGSLPLITNMVLKSTPPPYARTYSIRHFITAKSRLSIWRLFVDAPPSNRTCCNKRKKSPPALSTTVERRVCHL